MCWCLVHELRAVLSYFEKRNEKDFFADCFDAAYGTWLHPGTTAGRFIY
jgi:hypothetical protein